MKQINEAIAVSDIKTNEIHWSNYITHIVPYDQAENFIISLMKQHNIKVVALTENGAMVFQDQDKPYGTKMASAVASLWKMILSIKKLRDYRKGAAKPAPNVFRQIGPK